jgi:hypothetical protein
MVERTRLNVTLYVHSVSSHSSSDVTLTVSQTACWVLLIGCHCDNQRKESERGGQVTWERGIINTYRILVEYPEWERRV